MLALIIIKVDNSNIGLKPNLSTLKKMKITKFKNPTKSKGPIILSNIEATNFLTSKTKIAFIQLR